MTTNVVTCDPDVAPERSPSITTQGVSRRAEALAVRLEQGARALMTLASTLTDAEWATPIPHDGRTVGVVVHHVGSMYPLEIQLAQLLAAGQPVEGVTMADVNNINVAHARDHAGVTKEEAINHVLRNSTTAAVAIRALTDEQLDRAATASLYFDAPVTCQFMLEDHAVRHSYHHLGKIRGALGRSV